MRPARLDEVRELIGLGRQGGRQTIETGPDGNRYEYSSELPENGGVITSLMDVYNNNIWLVEAIARITDKAARTVPQARRRVLILFAFNP